MNQALVNTAPAIGTFIGGGFFAGIINLNGEACAVIVAPKAEGQHEDTKWNDTYKDVPGAKSYFDGLTNTNAMAEAGSKLAQWARGLRIGGKDDWYIPAQDQLEIIYRNLKPTTETNSQYGRSGINLSALPPTYPYTEELPAQTTVKAFQAGGAEAFDDVYFWTSTQHAAYSDCAWCQHFDYGSQDYGTKDDELRASAVRSEPLSNLSI